MKKKQIWEEIREKVRELVKNEYRFRTWILPNELLKIEDGKVVIKAPDYFYVDWLNTYYKSFFEEAVFNLLGKKYSVEFITDKKNLKKREPVQIGSPAPKPTSTKYKNTGLKPRYSFDNFINGENTKFVYAVCKSIVDSPGKIYNPLYIYGNTGVGKTHILQAIGNEILKKYPDLKVLYVRAEEMFIEFIEAIANHKQMEFKSKFRNIHILLIDDIQYLEGKKVLQEEFFHTLNFLYENGKQIVITSNCSPNRIEGIDKRLKSRFYKGLVIEIPPPDLEARMAILIKKSKMQNFEIPHNIAYYIASRIKGDVSKLEGVLIKLMALSSLTGKEINEDLAYEIIKDLMENKVNYSKEDVLNMVAKEFHCKPGEIKSKIRSKNIVKARQSLMFILRENMNLSFNEIGKFLNREHSTVISGYKKIKSIYNKNIEIRLKIEKIIRWIEEG